MSHDTQNPYQSPLAVDSPTDESLDNVRPEQALSLVVARFRAERHALAATIFFCGLVAGLIAYFTIVEANFSPLSNGTAMAAVAIGLMTLIAGYTFPTPNRLRAGTVFFVLLCLATFIAMAIAAFHFRSPAVAILAFSALMVCVTCLLQSIRIERWAARMRREGLSLRATSLQVIYSEAVAKGGEEFSDHASG